jgi:TolB-like protein
MKRQFLLLVPVVFALFCATALPYRFTNYTQDRQAMNSLRSNSIAVLPFAGTQGARFAEEFSIQLGKLGRFSIVERRRIDDLYAEQDLDPGRIDQSTAVRLGAMLGAHAVVMGTVTEYRSGRVSASARLVAVETGAVAWQGSDGLNAADGRVRALASGREDESRLRTDPDFLAQWLARLFAESIK